MYANISGILNCYHFISLGQLFYYPCCWNLNLNRIYDPFAIQFHDSPDVEREEQD